MNPNPVNDPKVEAGVQKFIQARAAALKPQPVGNDYLPSGLQKIVLPAAQDRWTSQRVKDYEPERIENILRSALINGDVSAQWELFDLIEDTSARVNKNLNQRKRAVMSYIRTFDSWYEEDETPTPEADLRKKVVSSALWRMRPKADELQSGFDDTIYDMLDAIGKGITLLEVDWEVRQSGKLGLITAPQCTRYILPRYYGFPPKGDWIGLNVSEINQAKTATANSISASTTVTLTPEDGTYARLPQNKFLVCVYKGKSGHPIGGALLRRLAFWWAASNFTQSWFLNFAQIFGLPIRWANYDPSQPGLLAKICEMLENMGSAAWAAFPAGTSLELKEPVKAGTDNPQVSLLDRADKQYDLLILGQSGTTEISGPGKSGGSNAANKVLEGVEERIVKADADYICRIFNEQLIPMIVRLNYGDDQMCPELCLAPETFEDVGALVTNAKTAKDAGLLTPTKEDEAHIREKLALPAMSKGLEADWDKNGGLRPTPPPPKPGALDELPADARHVHAKALPANERLLNNTLEQLTGVDHRWLGAVKPVFRDLIAKAKDETISDQDLIVAMTKAADEMPELFDKLDADALAELIYANGSAALLNGAVAGHMRRRKAVAK